MGKATGFLEYERVENPGQEPLERIKTYREFHTPLNLEERQKQGARCMDCGVPFCQNGKPIMGMVSGCPLNNLCPEWNELVYKGRMEDAARRLLPLVAYSTVGLKNSRIRSHTFPICT